MKHTNTSRAQHQQCRTWWRIQFSVPVQEKNEEICFQLKQNNSFFLQPMKWKTSKETGDTYSTLSTFHTIAGSLSPSHCLSLSHPLSSQLFSCLFIYKLSNYFSRTYFPRGANWFTQVTWSLIVGLVFRFYMTRGGVSFFDLVASGASL